MLESKIQRDIRKYLQSEGAYCVKYHGSNYTERGVPDILCCWNGMFIGIETKRPNHEKEQTEYQKIHERNIQKANGIYILATSVADVERVIFKMKGLLHNEHFIDRNEHREYYAPSVE